MKKYGLILKLSPDKLLELLKVSWIGVDIKEFDYDVFIDSESQINVKFRSKDVPMIISRGGEWIKMEEVPEGQEYPIHNV